MKILIFGASGGTGRQLLIQGLEQGHSMTAFVRNPVALDIKNKNLSVVQGNILDAKSVGDAIKMQDAVISVLGNKTKKAIQQKDTTISQGLKNIIAGMKHHKTKRLLFVASFGVNKEIFSLEKFFIRTFLKNIFADIPTQEKLIEESELDWTIVHPARLIHAPKRGVYRSGEHLYIGLLSKISRADVADFLLKNIASSKYIKKIVTISY